MNIAFLPVVLKNRFPYFDENLPKKDVGIQY